MTLEEIDAQIRSLEKARKEELKKEKNSDLALTRELCKTHGFTARMLKGYLAEGRNRKVKE